ncbi:hypothetical protein WA026_016674 [Henosepilachna vigintioctopunctata]|uniref:Secreted protein n=1 Tax=Henosepilachna vigintioctopunctata TaxID=420089 RepID=A0AAW1UTB3_9CUCU
MNAFKRLRILTFPGLFVYVCPCNARENVESAVASKNYHYVAIKVKHMSKIYIDENLFFRQEPKEIVRISRSVKRILLRYVVRSDTQKARDDDAKRLKSKKRTTNQKNTSIELQLCNYRIHEPSKKAHAAHECGYEFRPAPDAPSTSLGIRSTVTVASSPIC